MKVVFYSIRKTGEDFYQSFSNETTAKERFNQLKNDISVSYYGMGDITHASEPHWVDKKEAKSEATDEDKMRWLFKQVHGEPTNCRLDIEEVDDRDKDMTYIARVMKGNDLCWSRTMEELTFEYLTRNVEG